MNELLKTTLEKNREKYLKHLAELTAIDTHTIGHGIDGGLEEKGQEYMTGLFSAMGADSVVREDLSEEVILSSIQRYNEGNPGHNYDGRYNVYATFKGGRGRSIMFNGHMDTMPAEADKWSLDPFKPVVRDGKLYGLGTADMKSGLMAAVMAVQLIKDAGIELPGDVIISSVADEEGGGNGSIIAANGGLKADAVIVCEPTNYELIAAHMGFVFFKVKTKGIAVHSGSKWTGVNAIEKSMKLIRAIDELEHEWLLKYKHPLLPPPNSNVGVIKGGTAGSTVPDECTFNTCVHYHPKTMSYESVTKEYSEAMLLRSKGDKWLSENPPEISIYQVGGSFEMDLDHDFVASFKESFKAAVGREVPIVGSPSGCDSRTWRNIAGCPTLQYGPGRLEECHAVDEYVGLDQYYDAILIYANLILNWCKGD